MEYNILGNTGLKVSRLCFGGLTVGPLQANLSIEEGAEVMAEAFESGINFIDTAELYGTYPYIKKALELRGKKKDIVISSKSYAYDKETAQKSVDKALRDMKIDHIDIFLLHEMENEHTIRGHYEALSYYIKMKEEGIIKAVGISAHTVRAVEIAGSMEEIDVIHPIINKYGLGIQDGTKEEMLQAIKGAHINGKGIYGMKPIGGGNLIHAADECFDYVLSIPYLHSIAVGMQYKEEVQANVLKFSNKNVPDHLISLISSQTRRLKIEYWCDRCGNCIRHCTHKALIWNQDKVSVDMEKCVLCGYCSRYCPQFCIKII